MWHRYEDKKPKDGTLCLTTDRNGTMSIERYLENGELGAGFYLYDSEWGLCFDHSVKEWCKIPDKKRR